MRKNPLIMSFDNHWHGRCGPVQSSTVERFPVTQVAVAVDRSNFGDDARNGGNGRLR